MRLPVLGLLAACSFRHGVGQTDAAQSDTPPIDSKEMIIPDASIDALDASTANCFGPASGAFRVCLPSAPTGTFNVTGGSVTYSTTLCAGGTLVTPAGSPELCVVAATSMTINTTFDITGTRPLVLISTGNISIAGAITVSAGVDPTACSAAGAGAAGTNGAGGGGGGGFGTSGGKGGKGNDGMGGAGGPGSATPIAAMRGGCSGAAGGSQAAAGGAANGGSGGGSLYLIANVLAISSNIDASGRGGHGGPVMFGGGGGGGSGGMLALYAPNVAISGRLVANGGAGGEGADNNNPGSDGNSPDPNNPAQPATCPNGGSSGSVGGNGAAGTTNASAGANSGGAAAGGGGGGFGVIRILSGQTPVMTGGVFSPAPS